MDTYVRTYVNRMTNLTSGQRSRIYGRSCHIGGKVRDGAAQQERRERGDGYTELPNEATAVDFVQPLCRMRQWSCNRLPINNALVSGARRKEKKKELKREVEGERQRRRRGERQRRHANVVNRATRAFVPAFVLVDDVAGLVHYPCVILIVFTLRLIDVR